MPRLRVIQTLTAGVEHVSPFLRKGITLCNARGVHDASTAELAVALTLASLRGVPDFVRAKERAEWAHGERQSLADKTVLIVGYGSIGAAVETRLRPFECDVLRVARRARDGVAGFGELPTLVEWADVVVLTVPLTEQTRGLVDATFLARMRDGALLVNVSRGPVVDTDALLAELLRRTDRGRARRHRPGAAAGRPPVVVGAEPDPHTACGRKHLGVPTASSAADDCPARAVRARRATRQRRRGRRIAVAGTSPVKGECSSLSVDVPVLLVSPPQPTRIVRDGRPH